MEKMDLKSVFGGLKRKAVGATAGAMTLAALAVPAFAAEGDLPTFTITQDMLAPVVTGVVSNIGVVLPVGLGMFAIMLGIRIIPGLFSSFIRMR